MSDELVKRLREVESNLYCAIVQMSPSDDKIICDRVGKAFAILQKTIAALSAQQSPSYGDGLLPCPFCGTGEARPFKHCVPGEFDSYGVQCVSSNCSIAGPQTGDAESAVAAWNTRAESAKQPTTKASPCCCHANSEGNVSLVCEWHDKWAKNLLAKETARANSLEIYRGLSEYQTRKLSEFEAKQEPYGYVYTVNGTYTHFVTHRPPDDAYDEGSLVAVYTAQEAR